MVLFEFPVSVDGNKNILSHKFPWMEHISVGLFGPKQVML